MSVTSLRAVENIPGTNAIGNYPSSRELSLERNHNSKKEYGNQNRILQ